MNTATSTATYAQRIAFVCETAARLHTYGTTAQRLEGAVVALSTRLGLDCEPWSNPTGLILSFSDPSRPLGASDTTRVIRLAPGENDLYKLSESDRIAEAVAAGAMSIAAEAPRVNAEKLSGGALLLVTYVFLYAPILYVIYTSFSEDIIWPFPPSFSLSPYEDLFAWRNLHNTRAFGTWRPRKTLAVNFMYNANWVVDPRVGVFNTQNRLIARDPTGRASHWAGQEVDTYVNWTYRKFLTIGGGVGAYANGTFFHTTTPNQSPYFYYIHHTFTM